MEYIVRIHLFGQLFSQKPSLSKYQIISMQKQVTTWGNAWRYNRKNLELGVKRLAVSGSCSAQSYLLSGYTPCPLFVAIAASWGRSNLTKTSPQLHWVSVPMQLLGCLHMGDIETHSTSLVGVQPSKCEKLKLSGEPLINGGCGYVFVSAVPRVVNSEMHSLHASEVPVG